MLANILTRYSRGRPDRRYNIDPASLGLQFGENLDPVSRAVHLLLRSRMASIGYPLIGYQESSPMARVQRGEVSAAPEMVNRMLDLLGGQTHLHEAMNDNTPKDVYANRLPTQWIRRGLLRLLGHIGDMTAGGDEHPMVQSFLPGTPGYLQSNLKNRRMITNTDPFVDLLRHIQNVHGGPLPDTLSQNLARGVSENDLHSQVRALELLEHLRQTTPPDQYSVRQHNQTAIPIQTSLNNSLADRGAF